MGKYDIEKHNRRLLPWFWQTLTNMSLVDVLTGVFSSVNNLLEAKEADTRQRVGYSIQRLSLETSLNAKFDPVLQRITVSNSLSAGGSYVFNEAETVATSLEFFFFNEGETLPVGANEEYIFNEIEASGSAISPFSVVAPLDLVTSERLLRAWIEAVQVTGTSYELTFI